MINNRQADIPETIVRFFSFFTILTNILVACFFTTTVFRLRGLTFKIFSDKGAITAITAFILIVGLVYQVVLRGIWQPTGMQYVVDELLHTVIPLYMLGYWWSNMEPSDIEFRSILRWVIYPVLYLIFVLVRGLYSGFYPYPFLNVSEIGWLMSLQNILLVIGATVVTLTILVQVGKRKVR